MIAVQATHRAHSGQRGQVLVLGMVLVGLALVTFARYFSAGQVVASRVRQSHALDAAAYSGALVQARALNMLAYLNRAQMGHHVAMAHLVTLASWAHFAGTEAQQRGRGNPPTHLISMLFGADHGAAYAAASRATSMRADAGESGRLGAAYAAHNRTVQHVLTTAQHQVVQSLPHAREQAMRAVLRESFAPAPGQGAETRDDSFILTVANDTWPAFVQRNPGQDLRPFLLDIAGLYQFLDRRDHTARNNWVVSSRCPSRRHELRRRGTTQLDGAGRWQSIDTQSFHALRSNRWIGCYFREYAMGWGWIPAAATHQLADPYVENPPENFSSQDFWRWVRESTRWDIHGGNANPLANSRAVSQRQRWSGAGLQAYFDIRNPGSSAVGFSATLERTYRDARNHTDGMRVHTRSAAETFFVRPEPRTDRRRESANLFRPYWQARLSSRLAGMLADGSMP